eukprot:1187694-Prorocentrum_minimum.AAC.2
MCAYHFNRVPLILRVVAAAGVCYGFQPLSVLSGRDVSPGKAPYAYAFALLLLFAESVGSVETDTRRTDDSHKGVHSVSYVDRG